VVVFKVVQAILTATRIEIPEKTRMTTSLFKSQDVVLKLRSKATLLRRVFHAMAARTMTIYPVVKSHPILPNIGHMYLQLLQTTMMILMILIHGELPVISHPQAVPTKWTFLEEI
jgi:hypothetical protein